MIENLGRANKTLDQIEKETIEKIENARTMGRYGKDARCTIYAKNLVNYMDHFVFYPIHNGYKRFLKFDGQKEEKQKDGTTITKKIVRDKKLLLYFIFFEFYKASEVLGGVTRQEKKEMSSIGYTPLSGGKHLEGTLSTMPEKPELEMTEPSQVAEDFEVFN
jgi:hypothetical protein